jgi:hypothetical protein
MLNDLARVYQQVDVLENVFVFTLSQIFVLSLSRQLRIASNNQFLVRTVAGRTAHNMHV